MNRMALLTPQHFEFGRRICQLMVGDWFSSCVLIGGIHHRIIFLFLSLLLNSSSEGSRREQAAQGFVTVALVGRWTGSESIGVLQSSDSS